MLSLEKGETVPSWALAKSNKRRRITAQALLFRKVVKKNFVKATEDEIWVCKDVHF